MVRTFANFFFLSIDEFFNMFTYMYLLSIQHIQHNMKDRFFLSTVSDRDNAI